MPHDLCDLSAGLWEEAVSPDLCEAPKLFHLIFLSSSFLATGFSTCVCANQSEAQNLRGNPLCRSPEFSGLHSPAPPSALGPCAGVQSSQPSLSTLSPGTCVGLPSCLDSALPLHPWPWTFLPSFLSHELSGHSPPSPSSVPELCPSSCIMSWKHSLGVTLEQLQYLCY